MVDKDGDNSDRRLVVIDVGCTTSVTDRFSDTVVL